MDSCIYAVVYCHLSILPLVSCASPTDSCYDVQRAPRQLDDDMAQQLVRRKEEIANSHAQMIEVTTMLLLLLLLLLVLTFYLGHRSGAWDARCDDALCLLRVTSTAAHRLTRGTS